MQDIIDNLISVCIPVNGHLVQSLSCLFKSVPHQNNLAILSLFIKFSFSQSGFTVFSHIIKLFMDGSELSIEPFRLFLDVAQEVLKSNFMSVLFVFISVNYDGGLSVWSSLFGLFSSFGFLSLMGQATRARNSII